MMNPLLSFTTTKSSNLNYFVCLKEVLKLYYSAESTRKSIQNVNKNINGKERSCKLPALLNIKIKIVFLSLNLTDKC